MKLKILHISKDIKGGIGTVLKALLDSFKKSENVFIKNGYNNFFRLFKNEYYKYEVLHFHGAWTLHILPLIMKLNKPTLISPHGAFHNVSLQKSKFKKVVAKYLYMKRCYQNADCIHALTLQEAKDIRNFGIKNTPIAIIPNGIDIDEKLNLNEAFKTKLLKLANNRKIILSLSRLHVAKGIELLIDSYKNISNQDDSSVLFIVGVGDEEYTNILKNKIKSLNLENNIYLLGEMLDENKNTMYDIADLFVLPSYNEGFGLTVLEAYRQKVPVVTTTATPFASIQNENIGWYVEPKENELTHALYEALALDSKELKSYGEKGYKWVEENYTIDKVMQKYEKLYSWLIDKDTKLAFLYKD